MGFSQCVGGTCQCTNGAQNNQGTCTSQSGSTELLILYDFEYCSQLSVSKAKRSNNEQQHDTKVNLLIESRKRKALMLAIPVRNRNKEWGKRQRKC